MPSSGAKQDEWAHPDFDTLRAKTLIAHAETAEFPTCAEELWAEGKKEGGRGYPGHLSFFLNRL
jgi:hypothetical protein